MKQAWCCEQCGASGVAMIRKHAGVWEGFQAVMDAHRVKSPDCIGGRLDVRVKTSDTAEQWRETRKKARIEAVKRRFVVDVPAGGTRRTA